MTFNEGVETLECLELYATYSPLKPSIAIVESFLLPLFADTSSMSIWGNVLICKGETQPFCPFASISQSLNNLFSQHTSLLPQRTSGKVVPSHDMMEVVNNANIQYDCGLHDCGLDEVLINSR